MTEWSQLEGGLKVPVLTKKLGQFVIITSKIVACCRIVSRTAVEQLLQHRDQENKAS